MPDAQIMDPNPHSLIKEPRLIEGLGQEVDKMSLEDLAIPESEEVLKMMGTCPDDTEVSLKWLPLAQSGTTLTSK